MLFPISSKAMPSAPKDKPAAGVLVRQPESLQCHAETRCYDGHEKQFRRN